MKSNPGVPTHITSPDRARVLGDVILDPQRPHPVVVVTTDESGRSSFDADEIAAHLRAHGDVWVVDSPSTWDLNDRLGSAKVFGDAAAVYPPAAHGRLSHRIFTPTNGGTDQAVIMAARDAAPGRPRRRVPPGPTASAPSTNERPSPGLHVDDTPAKVTALANHLLDPARDRPVAVVTIPTNRTEPWIDPQDIVDAAGPSAEVHLLATGPRTFQLTDRLNQLAGVYGGAGRVYDVGQDWVEDPYLSSLRFAYDSGEGGHATAALINDLIGALARTGHATTGTTSTQRPVSGTVAGLVPPSRALVELDDGGMATVWAERVLPGVDVTSLLAQGMRVGGLMDPDTRRITLAALVRDPHEVRAALDPGAVIHARVDSVTTSAVTLTPFPGVEARLTSESVTGNDLDDLRELLGPGEVVAARYLGAESDKTWSLTMLDVDDDEAITPLSIIDAGPPWLSVATPEREMPGAPTQDSPPDELEEQERLRQELQAAEQRLADAVARATDDVARRAAELETQLRARDIEIDNLQRSVRDARQHIARLERRVEHERAARRRAVQKSNKGRSADHHEVMGFADPEEQLRWDIERTWVTTTRPEDKDDWPLAGDFLVGPDFTRSLDAVEGVSRERVLLVLVRLLTGRGVRDDHPLRSSQAGGAPAVTRTVDGVEWVCRRAPLQQSSPSARRLSYWRHPSGQIELSRIAVHDDLTP